MTLLKRILVTGGGDADNLGCKGAKATVEHLKKEFISCTEKALQTALRVPGSKAIIRLKALFFNEFLQNIHRLIVENF